MSNTNMEWIVSAHNTDEVTEQVNKLLVKHGLSSKYQICNIELTHPKLTDYRVTFSKQA